jgi:hypothetical protein
MPSCPDLQFLFDGSRRVGLGQEYSAAGTIHWRRALTAELGLLAAGMAVDRVGRRRPGDAGCWGTVGRGRLAGDGQ